MSQLQVKQSKFENQLMLTLEGKIDETFYSSFQSLMPTIKQENTTIIDLQKIISINSSGIRDWIKLMQNLAQSRLIFMNCPKVFIDQANMVLGFLPSKALVHSFYVPYFNEELGKEKLVKYKYGFDYKDDYLNVKSEIDEEGVQYELDVVESKYFKFLKGAKF